MNPTRLTNIAVALFTITFGITTLYSFAEGWYSYLILWVLAFVISFMYLGNSARSNKIHLQLLFTISYCFYSLYMNITNYLFVKDPAFEFFMMVDSFKFWNYSNFVLYDFSDIWSYFKMVLPSTERYPLFSFINLILSFFSQVIDINNILVFKLQSVWIGAVSIPVIYKMFNKYLTDKISLKYSLIYAFFTHVVIYSIVFNRDPYIYLIYTIGAYLLVFYDTKSFVGLKLFLLMILACGFRFEHGIFFSIFLMGYLYLKSKKNKKLIVVFFILMPIIMVGFVPMLLNTYEDNTDAYQNQIERVERTSFSTGAALSKLPPGIKQIFMGINSQVAPAVPFWRGWYPEPNDPTYRRFPVPGYFTPWRFMEGVAAIFWLYIWGIIVVGLIKKYFVNIPLELKVLFFLSIVLIAVASSSINVRRIYCVYPSIFIIAIMLYNRFPKNLKVMTIRYTSFSIIMIYILYLSLKGF